MSTTEPSPAFWLGPLLGGSALSIVSTVGSYVVEKKEPNPKAVARDFILGAVLFLLIAQLLPDSTNAFLSAIAAIVFARRTAASSGPAESLVESVASAAVGALDSMAEDVQVKVGVPNF